MAIEEIYLRERPHRAEELMRRHREGRMELCGLYLVPTELCDRPTLQHSLEPALRLSRDYDVPLAAVMVTDMPGWPWSLADVIAERGLAYLSVSPSPIMSKPVRTRLRSDCAGFPVHDSIAVTTRGEVVRNRLSSALPLRASPPRRNGDEEK